MTPAEKNHYLISGPLPGSDHTNCFTIYDRQEAVVQRLLLEGRVLSYALSIESGEWWAVCCAETDYELQLTLTEMPLHCPQSTRVAPLQIYTTTELSGFCLN